MQIPLGPGGEFRSQIRAIAASLAKIPSARSGDDTAAISEGDGTLVVSVDASVEDVHFRRGWLSHEEIGWRATASALSDLAAAAATAVGVVVAVIVPPLSDEKGLVDVMRGVGAAAASVGARVLGGDLTSGAQWAVVITVFGRAVRPMSRVGARPGDGILGDRRARRRPCGLAGMVDRCRTRRRCPSRLRAMPRIGAAQWLAAHGATAMMDLSDGLGGDAEHLAMASGVQLEIELDRLPLHRSVASAAQDIGEPPEIFAAIAGEDYELLVALPRDFNRVDEFTRANDIALTRIGRVTAGAGVRATLGGTVRVVHGFRHAV